MKSCTASIWGSGGLWRSVTSRESAEDSRGVVGVGLAIAAVDDDSDEEDDEEDDEEGN